MANKKEPDYYYCRFRGNWAVFHRLNEWSSEKVFDHWDREVVRKKVFELNRWEYKEN